MYMKIETLLDGKKNFLFLGGAGSGKSEIAVNFALQAAQSGLPVHFFDLDMTKPLFRSRDCATLLEEAGVIVHYQQQFMDAPTQVGGVHQLLRDPSVITVLDVGGDDIGARTIGGYAALLNQDTTAVYYVLNVYRPWSSDIQKIDETLGKILGVSHIDLHRVQFINNPNIGPNTSILEFLYGCDLAQKQLEPYCRPAATCIREELLHQAAKLTDTPLFPLHIHFSEPWLGMEA